MADTRYLKQVEAHLCQVLAGRFGQAFSGRVMPLTTGGVHQFDAVSEDGTVVAGLKTHGWQTVSGRPNAGGKHASTAELYYLSLVSADHRVLALSDREFFEGFSRIMDGKIAAGIELMHLALPKEIESNVRRVRKAASDEMNSSQ